MFIAVSTITPEKDNKPVAKIAAMTWRSIFHYLYLANNPSSFSIAKHPILKYIFDIVNFGFQGQKKVSELISHQFWGLLLT